MPPANPFVTAKCKRKPQSNSANPFGRFLPQAKNHLHFFTLHYYLFTWGCCGCDSPFAPSQKHFVKKIENALYKCLRQSKKKKQAAEQRGRMISSPTRTRQTDGHSFLPPSGREGDREAVEGASGHKSAEYGIIAGGYEIRPYYDVTIKTLFFTADARLLQLNKQQSKR